MSERINLQEMNKLRVEQLIAKYGCLPEAPDGPVIERFDPLALANAIEFEMNRGVAYGWTKITLHMDLSDATGLATFLRTARIG